MSGPLPADAIRGLTILVVEDQFLLADLATDFLTEAGAQTVLVAKDVPDALAVLGTSDGLGAAVIDINLGGQTGYQLAETLRAKGIPFVFATGYGRNAALPEGLRDVPVVSKPYTLDILAEALGSAVIRARDGAKPQT